jgi:nitroreductase
VQLRKEIRLTHLNLTADQVLTTTRAVRKRLDFDRPLDFATVRECLEIAVQAPLGSLGHMWHFILVDDSAKKRALAELYKRSWALYIDQPWSIFNLHKNDRDMAPVAERAGESARYLVEHMHRAPWLMLPVLSGRYEGAEHAIVAAVYGTIMPAVWSFMLAARERGLGTCWTSGHLMFEQEAADVLGIPYANFTQVAMIPIAHTHGTQFKAAPRKDLDAFIHRNGW